jgi:hypothetical protein
MDNLMFFWPCIIVHTCFNYQLNAQFPYSAMIYYIIILDMFRAILCSKHVEDYNVMYHCRIKEMCIKLVIETSLLITEAASSPQIFRNFPVMFQTSRIRLLGVLVRMLSYVSYNKSSADGLRDAIPRFWNVLYY